MVGTYSEISMREEQDPSRIDEDLDREGLQEEQGNVRDFVLRRKTTWRALAVSGERYKRERQTTELGGLPAEWKWPAC